MKIFSLRFAARGLFKHGGKVSSRAASTVARHQERNVRPHLLASMLCVGAVCLAGNIKESDCESIMDSNSGVSFATDQVIKNWSGTHGCRPDRIYEPKNAQEVCRVLRSAHNRNERVRPVGTAISPNGLAFSEGNLLSISAIDYIEVDTMRSLVTVGAGTRVSDVLKELSKHGLTLENFSSIQEQQIGGWTQVSAHGTGCTLSTVDDMIVRMKLATPTEGLLTLSDTSNSRLFSMAKVGLGSLGVVTELTLKCVPKFNLKETTTAIEMNKISEGHAERLVNNRHVRYMWLPYTSKVVSVVSNPTTEDKKTASGIAGSKENLATKPLVDLLLQIQPSFDRASAEKLSSTQLRDILLGHSPLDTAHIISVNKAEAQFWVESAKGDAAVHVDDSANILGFDCGGEQLVYEVCFSVGTMKDITANAKKVGGGGGNDNMKDLTFVKKLIQMIEKNHLPTPCPIEQRWSAASSAPMSPAYSPTRLVAGSKAADASAEQNSRENEEVFSWVGVIMYLPPNQTDAQREQITHDFYRYVELMQPLVREYNAHAHWAKIELPVKNKAPLKPAAKKANDMQQQSPVQWLSSFFSGSEVKPQTYEEKVANLRTRVAERYDVVEFNNYRKVLDPKGVLSNDIVEELFGSARGK